MWPVNAYIFEPVRALKIFSQEGNLLKTQRDKITDANIQWLSLEKYPPFLIKALLSAEDRFYFIHQGINPLAICRAFVQNLKAGRIISGGSTITQQSVRIAMKDRLSDNSWLRKPVEALLALKVNQKISKDQLLEFYLNRVPVRFNYTGFAAASMGLFGRDIRFTTREEQVALVVLLRGGSINKKIFKKRFSSLWHILMKNKPEGLRKLANAIYIKKFSALNESKIKTLHFQNWLLQKFTYLKGSVNTTISDQLSVRVNSILKSELVFLQKYYTENGAVVVLEIPQNGERTLKLRVMVGSKNFYGKIEGQVNGCVAIRNAGSTLKPLLYGLVMDHLKLRPWTIINDRDSSVIADKNSTYHPQNYDLSYWGPLTLREALGSSRNIPAVNLLKRVGIDVFYDFLLLNGFDHLKYGPQHYGPALALGTGGASLLKLTRSYGAFINKGILLPIKIASNSSGKNLFIGKRARLYSKETAWRITHILNDQNIRRRASGDRNFLDFPFDVAAKTGTSKDYRDAWTIGYSKKYIVGVWVGNFSGKAMRRVSGIWGAGRIFQQVMRLLHEGESPRFLKPQGFKGISLCRRTGLRATKFCPSYTEMVHFRDSILRSCNLHKSFIASADNGYNKIIPKVLSPVDGEVYVLNPLLPDSVQAVPLRILFKYSKNNSFYYQIDGGMKAPLRQSIADALRFKKGAHRLRILREGRVIERIDFVVK